jgi:hypothetical protein
LLTGSQSNASSITGWSLENLSRSSAFQLPSEAGLTHSSSRLTVDSTGRYLSGNGDLGAFTFDLSVAVAATATVVSDGMTQIQVGLRKVGSNSPPSLRSLRVRGQEDSSVDLGHGVFESATSDAEDDSVVYVLRSAPVAGAINLNANGSLVFQPFENWHGSESVLLQAYDGLDWSQAARFDFEIESVDDAPRGILLPHPLVLPESSEGSVLGHISVDDVDLEDVYRWELSDDRFAVVDGSLRLKEGVALNFEKEDSVQFTVRAINDDGDVSLESLITIAVADLDDPATGISFIVSPNFKPNSPGSEVGTVAVIDEDEGEVYEFDLSDDRFVIEGNTVFLKPDQSLSQTQMSSLVLDVSAQSKSTGTRLELAAELDQISDDEDNVIDEEDTGDDENDTEDPTPFHNDENPFDVNGDGVLSPLDPLILINYINTTGGGLLGPEPEGEGAPGLDVDGDGRVTPIDILILINEINRRAQTGAGGRPIPGGGANGSSSGSGNQGGLSGEGEAPSNASIDSTLASFYANDSEEVITRRLRRIPR